MIRTITLECEKCSNQSKEIHVMLSPVGMTFESTDRLVIAQTRECQVCGYRVYMKLFLEENGR